MPPEMQQNKHAIKIVKRLFFAVIFLAIVACFAIGTSVWLYLRVQNLQNPTNINQVQASASVIKSVGKLMILPKDETPTVATVSDPSKLKDQPFFAKAKIGDKVLIYTTAKKAILWRPSNNQIIEVSPLDEGNTSSEDITGI